LALKDILVSLTSYPEPSPLSVVDDAIAVAAAFGAHLSALSCETHVQVPGHLISGSFGSFANIPGIIAGEGAKSRENAEELLAAFDKAAERAGVPHEAILQKCTSTELPDLLVDYARLRDLTMIAVPEAYDQVYAEAVIFGSGRPTLVLPETPRSRPFELGTVAVAWDFSRAAARAISDALPFLEKARKVRVVTVTDEKHMDPKHSAEELAKNLARHEIDIVLDRVEANGKPIGSVLESYTLSHQADLLVMGAYGHSRLRQFILGGATKSFLSKPPLPILFSH
jgi:nucleotide-binding universal stress UspA family protein